MKNVTAKLLSLAAATALIGAGSAQAIITVDDFEEPLGSFQSVEVDNSMPTDFDQLGPFDPNRVIGGYRDLQLDLVQNGGLPFSGASAGVFAGRLFWSNDAGVSSGLTVQWDGDDNSSIIDPTGLGGLDLTAGGLDRLAVELFQADLPGLTAKFTIWTDENNFSVLERTFDSTIFSTQTEFFEFADFDVAGGSGADFADVGAIELMLMGPASIDAEIEIIGIVPPIGVPEASSLLGLGFIGGLGLLSLRKKSFSKS